MQHSIIVKKIVLIYENWFAESISPVYGMNSLRNIQKRNEIRIATPYQPWPVTRSSNRRRHSPGRFLFYCPTVRFLTIFVSTFLYFRLLNGAAAKQRGWTPRGGYRAALFCVCSSSCGLITQPSTIPPRGLSAFHNFPFLCTVCSLLRLITGYLVELKRKTERGRKWAREGKGTKRGKRSHDLCVNGVLARKKTAIEIAILPSTLRKKGESVFYEVEGWLKFVGFVLDVTWQADNFWSKWIVVRTCRLFDVVF